MTVPDPTRPDAVATTRPDPPRVALVGLHGYGRTHLATVLELSRSERARLVAVVDPQPPTEDLLPAGVAVHRSLGELLAAGVAVDVVVLATPIHTHAPLAIEAMAAGADVYLEKPPTSTLADLRHLQQVAARSGRLVQVGFQSLGSHAVPALTELLASGRIGELRAVSATGLWLRRRAYYERSRWAGRRRLDGVDVVDGVTTNPLAHAVATACALAGARREEDLAEVDVELYRAHPIEADDTSVVRLRTTAGIPVTCALTLCAPAHQDPWVRLEGTLGRATFFYTRDEVVVEGVGDAPGGSRTQYTREELLSDLIEVRAGRRERLLVPLVETGAFTRVLEAVRTAPEPHPVGEPFISWVDGGPDDPEGHPVLHDVADTLARVSAAQVGPAALGLGWAEPGRRESYLAERLRLAGRELAAVRLPDGVAASSSPRPVLHPVRTLGGVVLSDHQPLDHVWHLGVGVAVPDVAGTNCWGGRTYTRADGGYRWRADHGDVVRDHARLQQPGEPGSSGPGSTGEADAGELVEELTWRDPARQPLLRESRRWRWSLLPAGWRLDLELSLAVHPDGPATVELGSPGSHGRPGGGYGGFFWRLPAVGEMRVLTAEGEGEQTVHGSTTPWLAVTGTAPHGDGPAPFTLLLAAPDDDPWFVRVPRPDGGYAGVGRSLMWDAPRTVAAEPLHRRVSVAVLDGCGLVGRGPRDRGLDDPGLDDLGLDDLAALAATLASGVTG